MSRWSGGGSRGPDPGGGRCRRPRGISMAALLIALIILTVGILGVLSAFAPGYTSVSTAGRQDHAVALAYDKLEELRNYPWAALTTGADTPPGGYARTWAVTKTANLATLQIRITHPGIPNPVTLVAYMVAQ